MTKQRGLLAILLLLTLTLLLTFLRSQGGCLSFIDARVYLHAAENQLAGRNPYQQVSGLNFVYPPVFLYASKILISWLSAPVAKTLYVLLHITAAVSTPWIIGRYYLQAQGRQLELFYLFYLLSPGLSFLLSLDTGNIAVIAYATILLCGARGLRKDRWLSFYLATCFFASIKITFLPILLLPLLTTGISQFAPSLICAAIPLAGLKAQAWIAPGLFNRFQQSLAHQSMDLGDVGAGLFGITFHILHKLHHPGLLAPALAYGTGAITVVGTAFWIRRNAGPEPTSDWPALLLLVIYFAIPRVEYYDLSFGCAIAIFLTARELRWRGALLLYLAIALPALYFRLRTPFTAQDGGFQTIATLALTAVLLTRIARSRNLSITASHQASDRVQPLLPSSAPG